MDTKFMQGFRRIRKALTNPKLVLTKFIILISPLIPDSYYLRLLFRLKLDYPLNLNTPSSYNEKLQWLKLFYRNPAMPNLVDKFEAKNFVAKTVGENYVVKTYGVWERFEDIEWEKLPKCFVIKTTHDQGGVLIVNEDSPLNYKKSKRFFNKRLKKSLYWLYREWPYRKVKPRILVEELLLPETNNDLLDYKFYCFDGTPKIMYISGGRKTGECTFDFYDMHFNPLAIKRPGYGNSNQAHLKPKEWDEMLRLSQELSAGFPHVRVDFYIVKGRVLVGELTFFQGGGMMPFIPRSWDYKMGSFLELPSK